MSSDDPHHLLRSGCGCSSARFFALPETFLPESTAGGRRVGRMRMHTPGGTQARCMSVGLAALKLPCGASDFHSGGGILALRFCEFCAPLLYSVNGICPLQSFGVTAVSIRHRVRKARTRVLACSPQLTAAGRRAATACRPPRAASQPRPAPMPAPRRERRPPTHRQEPRGSSAIALLPGPLAGIALDGMEP